MTVVPLSPTHVTYIRNTQIMGSAHSSSSSSSSSCGAGAGEAAGGKGGGRSSSTNSSSNVGGGVGVVAATAADNRGGGGAEEEEGGGGQNIRTMKQTQVIASRSIIPVSQQQLLQQQPQWPPAPYCCPFSPEDFYCGEELFAVEADIPDDVILSQRCLVGRCVNVSDGDSIRVRHIPMGHLLYPLPQPRAPGEKRRQVHEGAVASGGGGGAAAAAAGGGENRFNSSVRQKATTAKGIIPKIKAEEKEEEAEGDEEEEEEKTAVLASQKWKGRLTDNTIRIRLYGVDAPETAKWGQPGQPFAKEATEFVTQRLLNKVVYIKCLERDQYGRLLARVLLPRPAGGGHAVLRAVSDAHLPRARSNTPTPGAASATGGVVTASDEGRSAPQRVSSKAEMAQRPHELQQQQQQQQQQKVGSSSCCCGLCVVLARLLCLHSLRSRGGRTKSSNRVRLAGKRSNNESSYGHKEAVNTPSTEALAKSYSDSLSASPSWWCNDICEELLMNGLACLYRGRGANYCEQQRLLLQLEKDAQAAGVGMWGGAAGGDAVQLPGDYKREHKQQQHQHERGRQEVQHEQQQQQQQHQQRQQQQQMVIEVRERGRQPQRTAGGSERRSCTRGRNRGRGTGGGGRGRRSSNSSNRRRRGGGGGGGGGEKRGCRDNNNNNHTQHQMSCSCPPAPRGTTGAATGDEEEYVATADEGGSRRGKGGSRSRGRGRSNYGKHLEVPIQHAEEEQQEQQEPQQEDALQKRQEEIVGGAEESSSCRSPRRKKRGRRRSRQRKKKKQSQQNQEEAKAEADVVSATTATTTTATTGAPAAAVAAAVDACCTPPGVQTPPPRHSTPHIDSAEAATEWVRQTKAPPQREEIGYEDGFEAHFTDIEKEDIITGRESLPSPEKQSHVDEIPTQKGDEEGQCQYEDADADAIYERHHGEYEEEDYYTSHDKCIGSPTDATTVGVSGASLVDAQHPAEDQSGDMYDATQLQLEEESAGAYERAADDE